VIRIEQISIVSIAILVLIGLVGYFAAKRSIVRSRSLLLTLFAYWVFLAAIILFLISLVHFHSHPLGEPHIHDARDALAENLHDCGFILPCPLEYLVPIALGMLLASFLIGQTISLGMFYKYAKDENEEL